MEFLQQDGYYPDIDDEDYYEKIYKKKQFYITKTLDKIDSKDSEQRLKEMCNKDKQFVLSKQQEFLRNYMSPDTPYMSLLIYHGLGSGKTCSAITIAEGLKSFIMSHNKKMIVLGSDQLKQNFLKEVYDFGKEEKENEKQLIHGSLQCTGDSYFLPLKKTKDEKLQREKDINNNKKKYYDIFGYRKFANNVKKLINKSEIFIANMFDETYNIRDDIEDRDDIIRIIKKTYDNTAMIVDEAHNITSDKAFKFIESVDDVIESDEDYDSDVPDDKTKQVKESKIIRFTLLLIVRYASNFRLILLSGTPISDNKNEFFDLMNFLIINQNKTKPNISSKLLDSKRYIKDDKLINVSELETKIKGYISYLKGADSISYPQTLYPINTYKTELYNHMIYKLSYTESNDLEKINRETIEKMEQHLKIIPSYMNFSHFYYYTKVLNLMKLNKKQSESSLFQLSNIYYPSISLGGETTAVNWYTNKNRLTDCFSINNNKYSYKKEYDKFMNIENLKTYSMKMFTILTSIINPKNKGIQFVYSQFKAFGIIPMTYILELNGYENSNSPNKFTIPSNKKRCYCGILKEDHIKVIEHEFIQGKFTTFIGDTKEQSSIDAKFKKINHETNRYGQHVKIVLGTQVIAEGVSLFRVRHIHLMEPWHNFSRIYQIIGRGIRMCSHHDLEKEDRNVTVNLYCGTIPLEYVKKTQKDYLSNYGKNSKIKSNKLVVDSINLLTETIDEKTYKNALNKDIINKQLERVSKIVAIDCNFNRLLNIVDDDYMNKRECDYTDCDYLCNNKSSFSDLHPDELDKSTYSEYYLKSLYAKLELFIRSLFEHNFISFMSVEEIFGLYKKVDLHFSDDDYIYLINVLMNINKKNDKLFKNRLGTMGYLIFKNPYILFQPMDKYENISVSDREIVTKNYPEKILLISSKSTIPIKEVQIKKKTVKPTSKQLDKLTKLFNFYIENFGQNNTTFNYFLPYEFETVSNGTRMEYFEKIYSDTDIKNHKIIKDSLINYLKNVGILVEKDGTFVHYFLSVDNPTIKQIKKYNKLTDNWDIEVTRNSINLNDLYKKRSKSTSLVTPRMVVRFIVDETTALEKDEKYKLTTSKSYGKKEDTYDTKSATIIQAKIPGINEAVEDIKKNIPTEHKTKVLTNLRIYTSYIDNHMSKNNRTRLILIISFLLHNLLEIDPSKLWLIYQFPPFTK
jgi:hypothetical protein